MTQFTKPNISEVAPSCPTLCDPMDYSLPGSSIHGIFQARVLEWVAISFSRGSAWPSNRTWVSALQADALLSESPGKPNICKYNFQYNQNEKYIVEVCFILSLWKLACVLYLWYILICMWIFIGNTWTEFRFHIIFS